MASINLVAGETVDPGFAAYTLDEASAANIKSQLNRVVGTCRYIGIGSFSLWESCEGTTSADTRRQLVDLIKFVDSRLPRVGQTPKGLNILNPNTIDIVGEGLARVRLNTDMVAGSEDFAVGYYDTTSALIEVTREAFLEAMFAQMQRGEGQIFDAITKSQQLYCAEK